MAYIEVNNCSIDMPIYNSKGRSLKNHIIQIATGGQLRSDKTGRVVVRALEGLSFCMNDGDRVGVIGHNGAGKSTLLRLISGIYEPSTGTSHIEGEVHSLIDISLGIDPEATGRENIFLRGALLGMTKSYLCEKFDEIVEFSELGEFVDLPLRTYSAGMHLRLAFAVSTIIRSEILLMDEWLSVGDEKFKHKVDSRLAELLESSSMLLIASHSQELIMNTCNRVIWLEHGKLKMDTTPKKACAAYFG